MLLYILIEKSGIGMSRIPALDLGCLIIGWFLLKITAFVICKIYFHNQCLSSLKPTVLHDVFRSRAWSMQHIPFYALAKFVISVQFHYLRALVSLF